MVHTQISGSVVQAINPFWWDIYVRLIYYWYCFKQAEVLCLRYKKLKLFKEAPYFKTILQFNNKKSRQGEISITKINNLETAICLLKQASKKLTLTLENWNLRWGHNLPTKWPPIVFNHCSILMCFSRQVLTNY